MHSNKIIKKIKRIRQKAAKKTMELIIVACTLAMIISCGKPKEEIVEVEEPSPITWESCSHNIGDHPCDFTLVDQNGNDWNLYENGWHVGESSHESTKLFRYLCQFNYRLSRESETSASNFRHFCEFQLFHFNIVSIQ